jgi:hypothetical protein
LGGLYLASDPISNAQAKQNNTSIKRYCEQGIL